MDKLLGILPYLYFYDEPIRLGSVTLFSLPDIQGRDFAPKEETDREYLQELSKCFPVPRGFISDKGKIKRALTYFILQHEDSNEQHLYNEARKTINLLRYMILCPGSQGLNDFETSAIYTFDLPPLGGGDSLTYHCWINFVQEEWPMPAYQNFGPLGWYVDVEILQALNLEDFESINRQFYGALENKLEANILLAIEWYNYSFLKYSPRGLEGRLIDISIAFDTLFRLQENNSTLYDCINTTLEVAEKTPLERWSRDFYGKVRSATMHFGKPATLVYKHPQATEGHISFLLSAQKIFRECVAVKAGLNRRISNDSLIEELTPNEVILKKLKSLGSYKKIKNERQFTIWKLRQTYPVGERADIVWLGKLLLSEMSKQISVKNSPALSSVISLILSADSDDANLWSKYVQLDSELNRILFGGDVEQAKQLSKCFFLAHDVSQFARFAWYALQRLTYNKKRN